MQLGPSRLRQGGLLAAFVVAATLVAQPAALAQQVVGTIDFGVETGCQEIAVDQGGNRIFAPVVGIGLNTIDGASDTVTATAPTGAAPWGVAFNPATGRVYVANQNGGGVTVIDSATNTVFTTIESSLQFSGVTVDPSTNTVYASQENSSSLWIIDGATNTGSPIDIGVSRPALMVLNPNTGKLYIGNNTASPIKVLDTATNTVVASISLGLGNHMALDLVHNRLYVAQVFAEEVAVVDLATDTVASTIPIDPSPLSSDPVIGVAYNPNTNHVFVSRALSHTVVVFDGGTFAQIAMLNAGNFGFGVNEATNKVYSCERGAVVDGDPPILTRIHVIQDAAPFSFAGFYQPVDNPPVLNSVEAGQGIPVKFSLGGDRGLDIFAAGYPKSEQTACDPNAQVDGIESTVTAGSSSLTYDPVTDQYVYAWKTKKPWAGTCRQLVVKLSDGSSHRANFMFR